MTMTSANLEQGSNNNSMNQQALSKKAFLGSNTSIGRNNRDSNIPVRAVSPRVRWVEDKHGNETYGLQQMSTSQQNVSNPVFIYIIINDYPNKHFLDYNVTYLFIFFYVRVVNLNIFKIT
jgi:hypothetical protein